MAKFLIQDGNEDSGSESADERTTVPYRIWFVAGIAASVAAIWDTAHFELIAKIAWTIMAPGFTLSQTWSSRRDLMSWAGFGVLLVLHFCLMEFLFPHLPSGHYGYILVIAIAEIMTLGLAYQVWISIRTK